MNPEGYCVPVTVQPAHDADMAALHHDMQQQVQLLQQLAPGVITSTAAQLELLAQLQESLNHVQALAQIIAVQQQLTGQDPLSASVYEAAKHAVLDFECDTDFNAFEGDADAYDQELHDNTRNLLLQAFGVVDLLTASQRVGLARLTGSHPHQVHALSQELRDKLRKLQKDAEKQAAKAAAAELAAAAASEQAEPGSHIQQQQQVLSQHPGYYQTLPSYMQQQNGAAAAAVDGEPEPPRQLGPVCSRLAAGITTQKERISKILENGVITNGGRYLNALPALTSWAARSTALAALAASYGSRQQTHHNKASSTANISSSSSRSRGSAAAGGVGSVSSGVSGASRNVLMQLGGSSKLFDVLEGWLLQAKADRQPTFMKQMLQVLPALQLPSALHHSSGLAREVAQLHKHTNPALAAAARAVTETWAAAAGHGSSRLSGGQQYAVPGGLIQCGGERKVAAAYKRKTTLAIKRQIEELELVGDLRKKQCGTAAAAAATSGAAAATGAPTAVNASNSAVSAPVRASGLGASSSSSGLKRPSKRPMQPSAAAAGAAAAAAATLSQSDASRRLAALHALGSKTASVTQRQQQQQQLHPHRQPPACVDQSWSQLPPQQQLFHMAPHGRAPATFLAAAGALAAEVTQAVQAYDRAAHSWMQQRCAAAVKEQQAAHDTMAVLQQQQQQQQSSSPAAPPAWPAPPPAAAAACFEGIAAGWGQGQESQQLAEATTAAGRDWLEHFRTFRVQQQQGDQVAEPLEPASAAAAADASAAAAVRVVVPLHPTDEFERMKERVTLWRKGIRLPCHIVRPPTSAETARVQQKQQAEQQQQLLPSQATAGLPKAHHVMYQPQQQQQVQAVQYYPPPPTQEIAQCASQQQQHVYQHVPHGYQQQYQQPVPQQYQQTVGVQRQQQQYQQALQQQQQQRYHHPGASMHSQPQVVYVQQQRGQRVLHSLPHGYVTAAPPLQQQQQPVVFVVPGGQPQPQMVQLAPQHLQQQQQQQEEYEQGYYPQGY